ncbi:MAG TPA: ABC transporter ATP-binding protein [Pirellulaceae bacterium]|nr:ABC transporter ATP-binding protein [Pirellulaceae bacterium]
MSNTKIQPRKGTSQPTTTSDAPAAGLRVDGPHAAVSSVDTSRETVLTAQRLCKSYKKGKHVIPVLRGVDFAAREGEFTAIVGQSGSGKSTLLHLLGTLDAPDSGEIHFEQRRIDDLPNRERDALRNRKFGMIFQFYHLLPELSMLENVLMPMMISCGAFQYWRRKKEFVARAQHLLEMVGLGHRLTHKPRELSGGEMQRTAIARALIASPRLLLADEPTGNLDQSTGREILEILRTLNEKERLTIVMVTHDLTIGRQADHTVRLAEGLVETA